MNYYQYKRRAPRSRVTDFIKPFLVILVIAGLVYAGWKLFDTFLSGEDEVLSSEKVYLDIEAGSAKAMTAGGEEWQSVSTGIYLYEGEKIKTQSDGRITLRFFEKDIARLDKSSEVSFDTISRDAMGNQATMTLADGKLWVELDSTDLAGTEMTIKSSLLSLRSTDGTFAVSAPGMLYVVKGSVRAEILNAGRIVKSATIGVGQELIVDEAIAQSLEEGLDKEVIFALDDAFKTSNWYRWNQQQGGFELSEEEAEDEAESIIGDETTPESEGDETTTEDVSDETASEEENLTEDEAADPNDKEAPSVPTIEKPGSNGDTVTLDDVVAVISGSVSSDTEAVIVNDYKLSKFVPGSKAFQYTAKVSFQNLKAGENEYEVIAVDKAGNKSEAATITLVLPQEIYDEAQAEEEEEATSSLPEASATGGVRITSPNNGENLVTSETAFEIRGEVPANTAKVVVNDYTLSGYSSGSTSFLYRASSTMGNLEIGALNTYTAKAYDADDKLIGSATITIDVESGSSGEGAITITMPTGAATYTTTLDQIVLGGTVGKWSTRVRINGENLPEYIPGSEQWKKTVTLTPGENSYKVCAEKEGEEQGCRTITIDYQN